MKTLKKLILNDHAQEVNGESNLQDLNPLGRVPNVGLERYRKNNYKINRYLKYQESRIHKHLSVGNYNAIVLIFLLLLKNSLSYQLVLFHRTKTY